MLSGDTTQDIGALLLEARFEAKDSFGVDTVFVEKFLPSPKHIEVQILADKHGNVTHLLERDCTIQRRHQKIIEIAPAVSVSKRMRKKMHDAAVKLAKHIRYGAYFTSYSAFISRSWSNSLTNSSKSSRECCDRGVPGAR